MDEKDGLRTDAPPEAAARFVVTIQGEEAVACLVEGIAGVREFLLQRLWTDPGAAVLDEVAAALRSLDEPEAWAVHGRGDGRPFWHWWLGYAGGAVAVQRLTEEPPHHPAEDALRTALADAVGALSECSEALRRLAAGAGERGYLFSRHQAPP